ncbi:MAG: hypothetical protein M3356_06230 [Actinomycetota bacterium]|nr:hypothetical protein [Actinomycetota bacterium]
MVVTVLLAGIVGICLTIAIVAWAARRLGLPIQETLAWFGLIEHPLLPEEVARPGAPRTSGRRPSLTLASPRRPKARIDRDSPPSPAAAQTG